MLVDWRRLLLAVTFISLFSSRPVSAEEATPVSSIVAPEGFQVELLRSTRAGEDSWISLTFDDRGRVVLGLDTRGVARLTLPSDADQSEVAFERLDDTLRHCRGVLHAHQSLYVCATDSLGFYRLRDTDGDDRFDEVKLLKEMDYRSRYGHGTNQVVLGPDNMIYVVNGNDVSFPAGVMANSPYRDPHKDWLVTNPHDDGQDDRVGHILRTDPEGKTWEVLAGGFRNQFDMAFNSDGEMFTYDADMEWDAGLPWYRPTRLNHVVSGGEYGWRWGTGKWPPYYVDSLPTTLDTGFGSPTGIVFGARSNFPSAHRRGLFMADWQNGRILLVHLTPRGATYECQYESFVEGGPLNVCDMEFGPDGKLYFITGGRGSQSGLYRVSYIGPTVAEVPLTPADEQRLAEAAEARQLRHRLEAFHREPVPDAVDFLWPHLGSEDIWIRYAARVALERQHVDQWRERAIAERDPERSIQSLLALARVGSVDSQPPLLQALGRLPVNELTKDQLLALLRVYALAFVRQGRPAPELSENVLARLEAIYPHSNSAVNQELCELLVSLKSPHVIPKTLALLASASTHEEQILYISLLVRIEAGWDLESRGAILRWLRQAQSFSGGKLVDTVIGDFQKDYLSSMSEVERQSLAELVAALEQKSETQPLVANRPFVRNWQMDDLLPELSKVHSGRSHSAARVALAAAACLRCHRIGDEGGRIGPDLTGLSRRFDDRAILESILLPSKVIDPKYRHTAYVLTNGQVVLGRATGVNRQELVIETDPLTEASLTIQRDAIEESHPAEVSPMPSGLVDTLSTNEILDLLAYLKANGDASHAYFVGE